MPITRHFLGWDGPALQRAAAYLRDQHGRADGGWNLGHIVAVVPAQRAGRRLLELLVTLAQSEGLTLIPPNIVTTGNLPERLYPLTGTPASDLDEHLAWIAAMRSIPPEVMAELLPHQPAQDDLPGWWAYATQVRRLRDDLAGHRMRFTDVPRLCAKRGVDLRGEQRWAVLDAIEQAYLQTLNSLKLTDRNTERLDAITAGHCVSDGSTHIVLIASPDLNDTAAAMLRQVGDRVTTLVMAPDTRAEGFDDLGVLRAGYWEGQAVGLKPEQLCFVGRNSEQAGAVVDAIAEAQRQWRTTGDDLSADQITVGLGDEHFAGPVQRRLDLAGVPSRSAAGTPAAQSRPAVLLRALGRFMESHRIDALAELLRHPDIETYLRHDDDGAPSAIDDWLTLLDTYATEHLQGGLTDHWLGNPKRQQRLKALRDRVTALLPLHPAKCLPLPQLSGPIANALQQVYADTPLREHVPDEHQLALALGQIAELLREQAEFDVNAPTCPQVTASQAISLTLRRLADMVLPDEHDALAVELLGHLELALDDAPVMAITGMNEGLIPSSRTTDAFLPDSVRSRLSMHDNAHRYARDLMLLTAITHSRPTVRLIAARRTDDGDPLTPSRLLLACDDDTLVARIESFFSEEDAADVPPPPIKPGGSNRFLIPRPVVTPQPLNTLSVTAFRAYLACPYRFYLRYVLKLAALNDRAVEMDPMSFGSIAHGVLQTFGSSDLRGETNADHITGFLNTNLDNTIETRFGGDRRPAIRIQTEQLRQRLRAFADQQAELTKQGWRIEHVERDLKAEVTIDGKPFTIKGKVDRIDRHDVLGWRIYDYKTSDNEKTPKQTHQAGRGDDRSWVDLQLPLYRDLCAGLGFDGPVVLAYFNLPKKLDKVGPSLAEWNEHDLNEASEMRDAVIRAVREQRFWPPNESAGLPDGLERICADAVMQRGELIAASGNGGDTP
jgi:ATP-dependent helicase/nuclease subunit B